TIESLKQNLVPKSLGGGREPSQEGVLESLGKTGKALLSAGYLGGSGGLAPAVVGTAESVGGHSIRAADMALREGAVAIHGEDAVRQAEKDTGNTPGGMSYDDAKSLVDKGLFMTMPAKVQAQARQALLGGPPGSTPPPKTGPGGPVDVDFNEVPPQAKLGGPEQPAAGPQETPPGASAGSQTGAETPPPAEEPKYAGPQNKREAAIDDQLRKYGFDDSDFAGMSIADKVARAGEADMLQRYGYSVDELNKLDTTDKWQAAVDKAVKNGATHNYDPNDASNDWGLSKEDADLLRGKYSNNYINSLTPKNRQGAADVLRKANGTAGPAKEPEPEPPPAAEEGTRDAPVDIKTGEDVQKAAAIADQTHTPAQGEANNVQ